MFALQQLPVGSPGGFRCVALLRTQEEIATLQHKRASLSAFDPATRHIFPISSVQRQFPDIVASRSRAPGGLHNRNAFEGLLQIWSMPGFFLVRFVEQSHGQFCCLRFHRTHPTLLEGKQYTVLRCKLLDAEEAWYAHGKGANVKVLSETLANEICWETNQAKCY